jgi:hypothetical protein
VASFSVSSSVCFLAGFSLFLFQIFDARSTHIRRLLLDTRRSAEFSVAVRSCCRSHRSRRSSEFGAWPARAREPFLFDVRDGHVLSFSGLARWEWGLRRFVIWLGGSGDGACCHAPPSLAKLGRVSSIGTVLNFCLCILLWFHFVIFRHYEDCLLTWMLDLFFNRGLKSVLCNVYLLFG